MFDNYYYYYVYACVYIYIYTHTHTYITCISMYTHIYIYIYIYTHSGEGGSVSAWRLLKVRAVGWSNAKVHVRVLLPFQEPTFQNIAKPQGLFSCTCSYVVSFEWIHELETNNDVHKCIRKHKHKHTSIKQTTLCSCKHLIIILCNYLCC